MSKSNVDTWSPQIISPLEIPLASFFSRHKIVCELSPRYDNTTFVLEKNIGQNDQVHSQEVDVTYYKSKYGIFCFSDSKKIMRMLAGFDIKPEKTLDIEDKMLIQCMALPKTVRNVLGGIQPCKENLEAEDELYTVALRIESEDLLLKTEVRGKYEFWENLLQGVDHSFITPASITSKKDDYLAMINVPLSIGNCKINSSAAENIEIGDVLLIDSQSIDRNGVGCLNVDDIEFNYELFKENSNVCMKIIRKVSC